MPIYIETFVESFLPLRSPVLLLFLKARYLRLRSIQCRVCGALFSLGRMELLLQLRLRKPSFTHLTPRMIEPATCKPLPVLRLLELVSVGGPDGLGFCPRGGKLLTPEGFLFLMSALLRGVSHLRPRKLCSQLGFDGLFTSKLGERCVELLLEPLQDRWVRSRLYTLIADAGSWTAASTSPCFPRARGKPLPHPEGVDSAENLAVAAV